MSKKQLQHDLPREASEPDAFGRAEFGQRLAYLIEHESASDPLIISLFGEWGEGKTSVLSDVVTALKKSARCECIEFNPWRYPEEEALLAVFFHSVAKAIARPSLKRGEKIAADIEKKFPWVGEGLESAADSFFFGAGKLANAILKSTLASLRPSIEKIRERLKAELRQIQGRLVIVIDDADRLDGEELLTLFRLVKLTADFPNTTFLIALDDEAAAKSIGRFTRGGIAEGRRYIEKIIQVPLYLPKISPAVLRRYMLQLIDSVVTAAGREVNDEQADRFRTVFDGLLLPLLRTPRQAKRIANGIQFSVGLLPGELDITDQILLECARCLWPDLHATIRKSETLLFERDERSGGNSAGKLEKFKSRLSGFPDIEHGSADMALRHWLPQLSYSHDESESEGQRLCSKRHFWRYFSLAIPEDDIRDSHITAMIKMAEEAETGTDAPARGQLISQLREGLGRPYREVLQSKLSARIDQLTSPAARALALALGSASDGLPSTDADEIWGGVTEFSARITLGCLYRMSKEGEGNVLDTVQYLVINSPNLMWCAQLVGRMPEAEAAHELTKSNRGALESLARSPNAFAPLVTLAERMQAVLLDPITTLPFPGWSRFLWTVFHWGDRSALLAWVQKRVEVEPRFLNLLISIACAKNIDHTDPTPFSFTGDTVPSIELFLSENAIRTAITRFGASPKKDDAYRYRGLALQDLATAYLQAKSQQSTETQTAGGAGSALPQDSADTQG
jgi:hypothetical protein